MAIGDQWYIAIDPAKTEIKEVPSDLRGLDRIEYSSYAELGTKLTVLMEQRYPRRRTSGIEGFLAERQIQVQELLGKSPGLTLQSVAQVLSLEVPVAQLVVRPLVGSALETRGQRRGMKYYLTGTAPGDAPKGKRGLVI